jgi:signal transduction histidine kinase
MHTLIDADVPQFLWLDARRLRQILYNLVGNAIKFTPHGSVTVQVRFDRRGDAGFRLGATAILQFLVRDTGIGIAKEYHERIFEKFVQEDGGSTRTYGGTGLGLALVNRLVAMMGGNIALESEPDEGSTFILTLPVALQAPPVETQAVRISNTDAQKLTE